MKENETQMRKEFQKLINKWLKINKPIQVSECLKEYVLIFDLKKVEKK